MQNVDGLNVADLATRLIEVCRERSLKHNDDVPAVFRYFVDGFKHELDKFEPYFIRESIKLDRAGFHAAVGSLPYGKKFYDCSGREVKMTVQCVFDDNIHNAVYSCLFEYSRLRIEDTVYDEMLSPIDEHFFPGWERGLCLLADYHASTDAIKTDNCWMITWPDIFSAIAKAAIPLTKLPPTDLQGAQWFMKHTTVDFGNLPAITPELLRNAVRDGRLKNWKSSEKPNANNLYSIQEVKDLYKEHAHLIPTD